MWFAGGMAWGGRQEVVGDTGVDCQVKAPVGLRDVRLAGCGHSEMALQVGLETVGPRLEQPGAAACLQGEREPLLIVCCAATGRGVCVQARGLCTLRPCAAFSGDISNSIAGTGALCLQGRFLWSMHQQNPDPVW